jgi:enoyl-CoA hydratase/carnithine racemase
MNEPTFDHIRIDTDINIGGAVAHLVFDRPHVRNALNEPMMQEMGVAVDYLAGRADLRVVVLRGSGGHFCAGGDLNMMVDTPPRAEDGSDPEKARYRRFGEMLQRLNVLPQAVVAVVEARAPAAVSAWPRVRIRSSRARTRVSDCRSRDIGSSRRRSSHF